MYHSYESSYCIFFAARFAAWPKHATILHRWYKTTDPGGGGRALAPPRAHSRPCDQLSPTDERHDGKLCAHRTTVRDSTHTCACLCESLGQRVVDPSVAVRRAHTHTHTPVLASGPEGCKFDSRSAVGGRTTGPSYAPSAPCCNYI